MDTKNDRERKRLLFGDFVFHSGINVTIRRGAKWHDTVGEYLAQPSDEKDSRKCKVNILSTEIHTFRDLPARVVNKGNSDKIKTYSGLLLQMREVYGFEFDEVEMVTAVYFEVKEKEEEDEVDCYNHPENPPYVSEDS